MNRSLWALVFLCLLTALQACGHVAEEELTREDPYTALSGKRYRVIADDLYAYGIYGNWPDRTVTGVKLIPGVGRGIGGRELAFKRNIPKGQIITVLSAWRRHLLFENGVFYRVALADSDLRTDIPIEVELFRGNQGGGIELKPQVYEQLTTDQ